jgi:hypothetical protein
MAFLNETGLQHLVDKIKTLVSDSITTATTKTYTITVPSSEWVGNSAPYTNTITVAGITANTVLSDITLDNDSIELADAKTAATIWDYLDTNDN